jgi:hypothetical protein
MSNLTISPVQWAALKHIDIVDPINEQDAECLIEIRDVLKKHGKLNRLGVALLHSHFDLEDDEIMLESTEDEDTRTLTTKAVKNSETDGVNVGTIWMLREGDPTTMSWCRSYCKVYAVTGLHTKEHKREK